ncbi:unnamed protein product [Mytilus edulis]|uniref:DZIP3-like HEPN domain-containing protein n=1 Tax=Mytilus edulis TaxID=6550 RepID=A0A8S3UZJ4_MYTED|nr:unnamed protein product [Mytilus edulis]
MENCETQLRDDIKRYLRLACLLLHIAPRALRRHFDHEFHPDKLQAFILQKQSKILELKQRRCITQTQYELLYPAGELSSTNFDMTLMTFLLRNFTDLSFSDKLPSDHLIDLGSDISRLGHYRNVIVHSKNGCVSEDEFRTVWECVSQAIKRLAQEPLCNGEISSLLVACLSGTIDVASIQQDVNQQRQLDELTERVLKLETENINRSEIRRKTISKWSEEDNKFVRTKLLELVTKTLTTQKAVILVGHPGCEDICGKFAIDQQKADQWTENDSKIEKLLQPNTNNKFLITTRVSIYKSEYFPLLKCLDIQEFNFEGPSKLSNAELRSIALSKGSEYVAIHDKMFDIISAVMIPLMFKCVIKFGNSSLLSSRIQLRSLDEKPNDFVQLLPTELERAFFDRLSFDIEQGCHWDVFGNTQTRFKKYRELFLHNLCRMQIKETTVGNDGSTPLFVSAYKGYQDFVEYLVDEFPEQIFQRDEHNRSPLYKACKQRHVGVVKYLLLYDKDVHQLQNRNCTSILYILPNGTRRYC